MTRINARCAQSFRILGSDEGTVAGEVKGAEPVPEDVVEE
jgi:hypothetical protein